MRQIRTTSSLPVHFPINSSVVLLFKNESVTLRNLVMYDSDEDYSFIILSRSFKRFTVPERKKLSKSFTKI